MGGGDHREFAVKRKDTDKNTASLLPGVKANSVSKDLTLVMYNPIYTKSSTFAATEVTGNFILH